MSLGEVDRMLRIHRAQVQGLVELRGMRKMREVYAQARAELEDRLRSIQRKGEGQTFTAHHMRQVLVQLNEGIGIMTHQLEGVLKREGGLTSRLAPDHLLKEVQVLAHHFTGHTPVLKTGQAAVVQGLVRGVEPTLLRRYQSSSRLYGPPVMKKMEQQMAISLVSGEGVDEATTRVAQTFGGERWRAERIVRCLPGETLVTGAVVGAAHRYRYEGPMIEVVTEGGRQFSATPNHPMLTGRGWVDQSQIMEGDYLVCDRGQHSFGTTGHENVAGGPTTIREIFDTFSAVGVRERGRRGKPNFDGEGVQTDVHIARSNRLLRYGGFSQLTEPFCKQLLTRADLRNYRFCTLCSGLLTNKFPCLCKSTDLHAHQSKTPQDGAITNIIAFSNFGSTLAGQVSLLNLIVWQMRKAGLPARSAAAKLLGLLVGSDNSHLFCHTFYSHKAGSRLDTGETEAKASSVQLDRVVHKIVRNFSGHVYNLTTPYGYYHANGVYTGNTELSYSYGITKQAGMSEIVRRDIPQLKKRLVATHDDRTGADSIQLDGQTVPVNDPFVWHVKDQHGTLTGKIIRYLSPPNRPNDREVVVPWDPAWGGTIGIQGTAEPALSGL